MPPAPESPPQAPPWRLPALLAAAVAVLAWRWFDLLSWAWPLKIDDAFISFRYAQHLAAGQGLTWNPGEAPVEGYSNFLWVLVLAAVHALGLEPLGAAKVLGLAFALAALPATALLTYRATGSRETALAAAFLLGFAQDFVVNAVLGLETPLYALLLALALASVLHLEQAPGGGRAVGAGLLLAACALTRPEGPMLFLVSAAWLGWQWRRALPWPVLLRLGLAFTLVFGPYLAFRVATYGDWLPTAVRAKQAGGGFVRAYLDANPALGGPEYVFDLLRAYAPWLLLAGATAVLATRAVGARLSLLALVGAGYLAGVWGTWPVMGLAHRLLLPVVVLLAALAAPAVVAWLARARTPLALGLGLVAAAVGARFLSSAEAAPFADNIHGSARPFLTRYLDQLDHLHRPFAEVLAGFPPLTVALTDCGIVPYYSRQRTIDLFGLNDRHLALGGPDVDYVLDQNPELVVLMSRAPDRYLGPYDWEKGFWESERFKAGWVRYAVRRGVSHHFVLFRRRDWAAPDAPPVAAPPAE